MTTSTLLPADGLRSVLRANALTSAVGGLVAAAVPGTLDRLLGTGHPGWVRITGVGLVAFAGAVLAVARSRPERRRRDALAVSAADATWVVASFATIMAGWFSTGGAVAVALVAAMVATFGATQLVLARRGAR